MRLEESILYIVTVEFVAQQEYAAAFRTAIVENARASREHERGCRQFDVALDPAQPATIFLYEVYDDRAAFDAHLATPHFRAFDTLTIGWIAVKSVRCYERIDP